jgi:hypothetical protein
MENEENLPAQCHPIIKPKKYQMMNNHDRI